MRRAIQIHIDLARRFLTVAFAVKGNLKGLTLILYSAPGFVDVGDRGSAASFRGTFPTHLPVKNRRDSHRNFSDPERLAESQYNV